MVAAALYGAMLSGVAALLVELIRQILATGD
jgi:hypothetical protein